MSKTGALGLRAILFSPQSAITNHYIPEIKFENKASDKCPTEDQVRIVSYSHDLKQLHQMVCDELTHQNVLGIPQEHNVNIQIFLPIFPEAQGQG
jgi:hypothetical protein